MISVKGLVKEFGPFRAVDGIHFEVPKGQILGFLGPNGAGKSTTMKMLTCFIEPTYGSATVGGKDIVKESIAVRQMIGYLPESAPSYAEMTVVEFLRFIAEVRGFRGNDREYAVDRMRGLCALADVWLQPIETLSKGYKQRVGFAQALIHDPPVLILDEPTDGLDPNQKYEVRSLIKSMAEDKTIILSTHILEEVDAVCERAIIIAKGRIVADGTPQELLKMSPLHNAVTVKLQSPISEASRHAIENSPKVQKIEFIGESTNELRILPRYGESIAFDVTEILTREKVAVEKIDVEDGRLDEVFRAVTKHQPTAEQKGSSKVVHDKSSSRHLVA